MKRNTVLQYTLLYRARAIFPGGGLNGHRDMNHFSLSMQWPSRGIACLTIRAFDPFLPVQWVFMGFWVFSGLFLFPALPCADYTEKIISSEDLVWQCKNDKTAF